MSRRRPRAAGGPTSGCTGTTVTPSAAGAAKRACHVSCHTCAAFSPRTACHEPAAYSRWGWDHGFCRERRERADRSDLFAKAVTLRQPAPSRATGGLPAGPARSPPVSASCPTSSIVLKRCSFTSSPAMNGVLMAHARRPAGQVSAGEHGSSIASRAAGRQGRRHAYRTESHRPRAALVPADMWSVAPATTFRIGRGDDMRARAVELLAGRVVDEDVSRSRFRP